MPGILPPIFLESRRATLLSRVAQRRGCHTRVALPRAGGGGRGCGDGSRRSRARACPRACEFGGLVVAQAGGLRACSCVACSWSWSGGPVGVGA
jgi:hypothetical protein